MHTFPVTGCSSLRNRLSQSILFVATKEATNAVIRISHQEKVDVMRTDDSGNEDLMKEAVSLLKRIELKYVSFDGPVVLGFNAQGWLFVYLGNDPMYRFDELGRLRRAFVDGFLFRTSGHTLAMLERSKDERRSATSDRADSVLLRRDLSSNELQAFRERVMKELAMIRDELPDAEISRQHPEMEHNLREKFAAGLSVVLGSTEFLAPAIVRR